MTLYVDTSAVLRAILERGTSPEVERRLAEADGLVTSRLAVVEAARAFARARALSSLPAERVVALEAEVARVWTGCTVWELSPDVCDLAGRIAPSTNLRTLDALHLATFVLARRRLAGLDLLTADRRLADAVSTAGV